jgi:tetratricopeptide (TPR) repeat protein
VESAPLVSFATTVHDESAVREADIAFYAQRVSDDPESATDRLTLARLQFARARMSGSTSELARAETLARTSVALRSQRNGESFEVLATVLMARHAFREARLVAARADALEPDTPSHLALLGEIELELGDYAAAATHFAAVRFDAQQFTIGARVARWYEVTGHADMARAMLARAIHQVDRRDDLPQEQAAWFHYRLGELELRLGRFAAADAAFLAGMRRHPDDTRILGGLARSALAQGNARRSIDYGERSTGILLDPATLATVSQAYAILGDSTSAHEFATAMSVSALTQPGAIHRAWGLFLLDHGSSSERADVLRRARRELRVRNDVYGHDLLAWALFRNGDVRAARQEMQLALSQRTEDVMLAAHALAVASAMP